ncbi:MAG: thymidylate synthase [Elusimicrobiota bacterium]
MQKPVFVEGRNLDEVWFQLLVELCKNGSVFKVSEGSFKGDFRLEFDFVSGVIHKPIEYNEVGLRLPMAPTVPHGCPPPTTDYSIDQYFANYLMDSCTSKNEHYRYSTWIVGGEYIVPNLDIVSLRYSGNVKVVAPNQLDWIINHYKKKGFGNNHCCMQIGYPESTMAYDQLYSNETERNTSPCLRIIDTKIVKDEGINKLLLNVYYRSWDLYGGWPENMGGFALLQEYIASELGIETGMLGFSSAKLHVYGHSIDPLVMRAGVPELKESFEKIKKEYML